ncbi:uncharacterized protein [Nicotiana sylvestris]|uniref:uncharacterized protein n=1 Tax=Nicotiana sylvestris TaxID=4096 RepID=UPI00388C7A9D
MKFSTSLAFLAPLYGFGSGIFNFCVAEVGFAAPPTWFPPPRSRPCKAALTTLSLSVKSSIASGLQANLNKSEVYFGRVPTEHKKQILQQLGFTAGELPFKYLGVPLSTRNSVYYSGNLSRMIARITSWTAKTLSSAGRGWRGLNITNLRIWNRAAIVKTCWDLAHKQDKLWIRWIHTYYIKGHNFTNWTIPQQACWMVRKVFEANTVLENQQYTQSLKKSLIKQIYLTLLGDYSRVEWKSLVFNNVVQPKAKFSMWLMMHGKLLTSDRLCKWGLNVDTQCVCQRQEENREHLFWKCEYTTGPNYFNGCNFNVLES